MDFKLTPLQAAKIVKHDKFDNAEKAFEAAREEAKSSREALYFALSAAYYWYLQIKHDFTLMTDKLDANDPKINWPGAPRDPRKPVMPWDATNPKDPNIPVDPFTPIVKLVFDYTDRKYASTVATYAKCLRFVDREIHDAAKFSAIYENHLDNPELAKNIIEAAGGVVACAEDQHAHENPPPKQDATQDQLESFWKKECDQIYSSKAALDTVSIPTDAPAGSYVLMMGRVGESGEVEVVETLERPSSEIFSIAESEAFQDVSKLDPALNIIADSIGFLNVFKPSDKPVFSVEKGGDALHISLDKDHSASIVVTARMKESSALQGFGDRAYLGPEDCKWFNANAQEHKYRRIYQIQQATVAGTVNAYELASNITSNKKTLHFNKLAAKARQQVILDARNSSTWDYEVELDRKSLIHLYLGWCQDWLTAFKAKEKRKGADRVITVTVSDTGLSLGSEFAIKSGGISLATGLAPGTSFEIAVSGHEFMAVIKQLLASPNFAQYTLRGLVTGVIELEAEDPLATYTVDIPMLIEGGKRYSEKHFAKLI